MNAFPSSISESEIAKNPKVDLDTLIRAKLPPLPGSVVRILQLLQDPDVSTRVLAETVGFDPQLTIRILKLANSPIYFLQRKVRSIQKAIDVIGIRALYDIVMLNVAAESFSKEIKNSVVGRIIWEHSLTVALFSRELSVALGMKGADEVFICGLLHDIGKVMLLSADPEEYTAVLDKTSENELLDWEVKTFGYDHAVVGSFVAQAWKLPDEVCRMIFNHHLVSNSASYGMVSHIVNVSDMVANINGYGLRLDTPETITMSESASYLGISARQIEDTWGNVEGKVEEVIGLIG